MIFSHPVEFRIHKFQNLISKLCPSLLTLLFFWGSLGCSQAPVETPPEDTLVSPTPVNSALPKTSPMELKTEVPSQGRDQVWIQSPRSEVRGLFQGRLDFKSESLQKEGSDPLMAPEESFHYFRRGKLLWNVQLPEDRQFFKVRHPLFFSSDGQKVLLVSYKKGFKDPRVEIYDQYGKKKFTREENSQKILEARISSSGDAILLLGLDPQQKKKKLKVTYMHWPSRQWEVMRLPLGNGGLEVKDFRKSEFRLKVSQKESLRLPRTKKIIKAL